MARTVNSNRKARTRNAQNGHPGLPPFSTALEFNLGIARSVLDSLVAAMRGYFQYATQAQQISAETVNDLSNVLKAAVDQAEYATNFPELLAGYRALTAGELMRAAENFNAFFIRLSDVEASLMQQARAAAATRSIAFLEGFAPQKRGTRMSLPRH